VLHYLGFVSSPNYCLRVKVNIMARDKCGLQIQRWAGDTFCQSHAFGTTWFLLPRIHARPILPLGDYQPFLALRTSIETPCLQKFASSDIDHCDSAMIKALVVLRLEFSVILSFKVTPRARSASTLTVGNCLPGHARVINQYHSHNLLFLFCFNHTVFTLLRV